MKNVGSVVEIFANAMFKILKCDSVCYHSGGLICQRNVHVLFIFLLFERFLKKEQVSRI